MRPDGARSSSLAKNACQFRFAGQLYSVGQLWQDSQASSEIPLCVVRRATEHRAKKKTKFRCTTCDFRRTKDLTKEQGLTEGPMYERQSFKE
jgi:hypothetical protein